MEYKVSPQTTQKLAIWSPLDYLDQWYSLDINKEQKMKPIQLFSTAIEPMNTKKERNTYTILYSINDVTQMFKLKTNTVLKCLSNH
jgi:uncharacterized protein YllA (UPF0747 family)